MLLVTRSALTLAPTGLQVLQPLVLQRTRRRTETTPLRQTRPQTLRQPLHLQPQAVDAAVAISEHAPTSEMPFVTPTGRIVKAHAASTGLRMGIFPTHARLFGQLVQPTQIVVCGLTAALGNVIMMGHGSLPPEVLSLPVLQSFQVLLRHRRLILLPRPCHLEVTVTGTAAMEQSKAGLGVTRTRTAAQMDAVAHGVVAVEDRHRHPGQHPDRQLGLSMCPAQLRQRPTISRMGL